MIRPVAVRDRQVLKERLLEGESKTLTPTNPDTQHHNPKAQPPKPYIAQVL